LEELVSRLRFTRDEAECEAKRLATEFVAGLSNANGAQCRSVSPDGWAPKRRSSKHPVAWVVVFVFPPSDPHVVQDGGELFISVDLESKAVSTRELL